MSGTFENVVDWVGIVLLAVGLGALPVGCTLYESRQIAEMVKAGVDPAEATCSMRPNTHFCSAAALRPKK